MTRITDLENLFVFVCLTAGIAMLALFAQGTRLILKKAGLRFTARRLLPWFLWAGTVLVFVSVTVFVALDGLYGDEGRLRAFIAPNAGERTPEAAHFYSYARPEEPARDDETPYRAAAGTAGGEPSVAAGTNPAAGEHEHRAYLLGFPDGRFRPDAGISRAETTVMFARLLEEPSEGGNAASRFADVFPDSPYAEALIRMEADGVVMGYPGGAFRPETRISRAEFITICLRLAERREPAAGNAGEAGEGATGDATGDVTEGARERVLRRTDARHWARAAVEEAAKRGWLDACASGGPAFFPDGDMTRAEAATIVNRMIGRSADTAYIRSHDIAGFRDVPPVFWAYPDITEASVDHGFRMRDGEEVWIKIKSE
jgi:hypothetical protein